MPTRRVLLIDDEADFREVAQLSLEMVGNWDVVAADSGADGIRLAKTEQPDAILVDVMIISKPFAPLQLPTQIAATLGWVA